MKYIFTESISENIEKNQSVVRNLIRRKDEWRSGIDLIELTDLPDYCP